MKRAYGHPKSRCEYTDLPRNKAVLAGMTIGLGMATSCAFAQHGMLPVDTSECKVITGRISAATNARVESFSELGRRVLFALPSVPELSLSCATRRRTGIFVRWDDADPPSAFFNIATKAGVAATGEITPELGQAIRQCYSAARAGKTGFAQGETPMARVECQSFTENGGGASISVWLK